MSPCFLWDVSEVQTPLVGWFWDELLWVMAISCSILDSRQIHDPDTTYIEALGNILLDLICNVHHFGGLRLACSERGVWVFRLLNRGWKHTGTRMRRTLDRRRRQI